MNNLYYYKGQDWLIEYNVVDYQTREYEIWLQNPDESTDTLGLEFLDLATQSAVYELVDQDVQSSLDQDFLDLDIGEYGS